MECCNGWLRRTIVELTISKKEKNKAQRNRIHKEKKWRPFKMVYHFSFLIAICSLVYGVLIVTSTNYINFDKWFNTSFSIHIFSFILLWIQCLVKFNVNARNTIPITNVDANTIAHLYKFLGDQDGIREVLIIQAICLKLIWTL